MSLYIVTQSTIEIFARYQIDQSMFEVLQLTTYVKDRESKKSVYRGISYCS